MSSGQWTILELDNTNSANLVAIPINTNGSFSLEFSFSHDDGCGPRWGSWSCIDFAKIEINAVKKGNIPNRVQDWFDVRGGWSITDPFPISYLKDGAERLFVFFHVTAGNATLSQVIDVVEPPA